MALEDALGLPVSFCFGLTGIFITQRICYLLLFRFSITQILGVFCIWRVFPMGELLGLTEEIQPDIKRIGCDRKGKNTPNGDCTWFLKVQCSNT